MTVAANVSVFITSFPISAQAFMGACYVFIINKMTVATEATRINDPQKQKTPRDNHGTAFPNTGSLNHFVSSILREAAFESLVAVRFDREGNSSAVATSFPPPLLLAAQSTDAEAATGHVPILSLSPSLTEPLLIKIEERGREPPELRTGNAVVEVVDMKPPLFGVKRPSMNNRRPCRDELLS